MKIETVNINQLNSPLWNPRNITKEELQKLEKSITEFGYVEPIIVNKHNMNVVGGNQRLKALKNLGYTTVDVIFINEPNLQKEQALNISLNNISGEWDTDLLDKILTGMEISDFDISLTSLDDIQLEELEININDDEAEIVEDEFDENVNEIKTDIKYGDKFQLGNHILLCGDATNEKDVKKLIRGGENRYDIH